LDGKSSDSLSRSFFPKRKIPSPDQQFRFTAKPASEHLIDQYAIWSGAPAWRYEENIPPHFCSHWAMSALATLGGFAPYDVRRILNQGLHLKINAPISRHDIITMLGSLKSITQDDSRIRIHTQVVASTPQQKNALIIDNFTAIPQKIKTTTSSKHPAETRVFQTIGQWSASKNDGLNFALLTGDYNPIHTVPLVGKRSPFGSCILQGFGAIARTYEKITSAGFSIQEIDLRFIKPLVLPSPLLEVQITDTDDEQKRAFRLCDSQQNIYLAGWFLASEKASDTEPI
jgi:acyl dehydratase